MKTNRHHYQASAASLQAVNPIKHQSSAQQRGVLLKWLQMHNQITTLEARNTLGIMHPASRIQELKKLGHVIATYWQVDIDVTGKKHRQGLYILQQGGEV